MVSRWPSETQFPISCQTRSPDYDCRCRRMYILMKAFSLLVKNCVISFVVAVCPSFLMKKQIKRRAFHPCEPRHRRFSAAVICRGCFYLVKFITRRTYCDFELDGYVTMPRLNQCRVCVYDDSKENVTTVSLTLIAHCFTLESTREREREKEIRNKKHTYYCIIAPSDCFQGFSCISSTF